MKPKIRKTIASALSFSMIAGAWLPTAGAAGYTDVKPDAPYSQAIDALTASGAMSGTGGGKFSPDMTVTRAQAVTTLGRLAGASPVAASSFSDVPSNEWYAGYVGWAVENGIVQGDGRGHFMPNALVTSEHMNIILNNYAKLVGVTLTPYDTGASTVTRADLAQRLYPLTPDSVAVRKAEEQKQLEDQKKLVDYDNLKKANDELKANAGEGKTKVVYRDRNSSSGPTQTITNTVTNTVYIDESMKDSEVLLPQRVHVTATGKAGCTAGETDAEHDAHTSEGWIMGYNDRGVYTFKGVNYATARRFENPKPAQYGRSGFSSLYSDDQDEPTLAMVRGAASPQAKTNTVYSDYFGFAYFMTPAGEDMFGRESDCLNLNIWTSSLNENAKKPILVFMHGGGTDSDAATGLEVYEGRDFAEHNDIVFVTVNARLGTLGYSRDFTEIGGGNNLAVRDMLLSLEWVKENAEAFGGDPNNITIAGQSGGGSKASYLIDSKYADENDLFQKVVAISASLGSNVSAAGTQEARNTATRNWVNRIKSEGRGGLNQSSSDAQVLSYLQGVRSDELSTALRGYSGGQTVDNYIFDDQSVCWSGATINARAAQYDYLIGNTWSEMAGRDSIEVIQRNMYTRAKGYMSEDDKMELMEEMLVQTPRKGTLDEIRTAFHKLFPDHDFYDLRTLVNGGQGGFTRDNYYNSSMRVSNGQVQNNPTGRTYEYLMAYEFPYFGGTAMYHTGDLAFWFYSLGNVRYQIAGDEENAYHVANFCVNALANFCKTGDPSANGITWRPHEEGNPYCLIIDKNTRLAEGDYGAELIDLMTRQDGRSVSEAFLMDDADDDVFVNDEERMDEIAAADETDDNTVDDSPDENDVQPSDGDEEQGGENNNEQEVPEGNSDEQGEQLSGEVPLEPENTETGNPAEDSVETEYQAA